jgi:two-component system OmpR family sensor kinase
MKGKTLLFLSLAPIVLCGLAAALLSIGWIPNPTRELHVLGDLAGLVMTLGIVLSLVFGALSLHAWLRNRSGRQLMQQQLDAARADGIRERRVLVERVDHELKHCLTVMRSAFSDLHPARLGPAEQKAIRALARNVRRLDHFLNDMRKLAMIEATPIDREELDMGIVVREAVAQVTGGAPGTAAAGSAPQVTVQVQDRPLPLPTVWGEGALLMRAVGNVVGNAVKFSPPGTPIEVWVLRDGPDALRIQVTDKGPGIPSDELSQVEEPFFRGKLAQGVPGSGLGLSIVRAILHKHGGKLEMESELGTGTVVTLHLPAGRPRPDQAP